AEISSPREENEALKKRLLVYENPHTPPSLQLFKPKIVNPPGKRGAPKGHKGATRIHDAPDEIIHVSAEKCQECSHPLDTPIRTEKKTISD
ncbi:transposase, partial [mine drainage metagenome]